MDRRSFLKLGAGSCVALSAVSLTASLSGCSESPSQDANWKVLRPADREFFAAIAPVVLKGAWPQDLNEQAQGLEWLMQKLDEVLFNLGPHNQKQMVDLFNLLNFTPSRGLTTGVWSKWSDATEADIDQFLNKWRESSLELFTLAYNGLSKLIIAIWYGKKEMGQVVGYPGPPYADILITKS